MQRLVLASSSPYRRELLSRLGLPFEVDVPDVDEAPFPLEAPAATAGRLARAKALAVAARHPAATVIGSDQVADLDGERLGKPGSRDRAVEQLERASGREVVFHTAVFVVDAMGTEHLAHCPTRVRFRILDQATIGRYVDAERPFDCAGSARSEALGITLLEYIRGDDPTALVGLPLIALTGLLARAGIHVP
jgi:septum formation protein